MAITMIAVWMALLWLLVKLRVLKGWALWMKLSPLVIYLGDHGADFLRGKRTSYEGGVRVPLIIRWPDGRRQRWEAPAERRYAVFRSAAGSPR